MTPKKVIIDTNLWISFLISKNYTQLDEIIFSGKCILIFSQELLDEFINVVNRPKFKKYFSQKDILHLMETIQDYAEYVNVNSEVNICRDVKDNFLLALSKDSFADFLITGDQDLLELKNYNSTKILTITEFLSVAKQYFPEN